MDIKNLVKICDSSIVEDSNDSAFEDLSNSLSDIGFVTSRTGNSLRVFKDKTLCFHINLTEDTNPYASLKVVRGTTTPLERRLVRQLISKFNEKHKKEEVTDKAIESIVGELSDSINKAEENGNRLIFSYLYRDIYTQVLENKDQFEYKIRTSSIEKKGVVEYRNDLVSTIESVLKDIQREFN